MFADLIGYFSIFMGALWTVRPDFLRGWFIGKSWRMVFWVLVGTLSYPLAHYGHKLGLGGFIGVLAIFWILMKLAGSAIKALFCRVPSVALRAVGLLNIVSGSFLVWWQK